MFSGKSEELMRRLRRHEVAGRKVILLRPDIDDRYDRRYVVSHNGTKMLSHYISPHFEDILKEIQYFEVIGIDEIQFFDVERSTKEFINKIIESEKIVISSGLDMDFRGNPFGEVPYLMALADSVTKLNAVCNKCGKDAVHTQRLIDGEPAPFSGPTIKVGAREEYEARCRECFEPRP